MPGSPFSRRRSPPIRGGAARSWSFAGFDYGMARPRSQLVVKVTVAFILTALCMFILRQSSSSSTVNVFSAREEGVKHVLVTGGAGYIGSHATMLLLENNYRVTIVVPYLILPWNLETLSLNALVKTLTKMRGCSMSTSM
jgi:UDP-arabinose 4-epimerase